MIAFGRRPHHEHQRPLSYVLLYTPYPPSCLAVSQTIYDLRRSAYGGRSLAHQVQRLLRVLVERCPRHAREEVQTLGRRQKRHQVHDDRRHHPHHRLGTEDGRENERTTNHQTKPNQRRNKNTNNNKARRGNSFQSRRRCHGGSREGGSVSGEGG